MKTSTKILNLLTAFMAVIGMCAAVLVCFIVIYTQTNGNFSVKDNTDYPQNVIVSQGNENKTENTPMNSYQDSNSSSEMDILSEPQETKTQPLTVQTTSTDKDIPSEYKSALNSANSYSDLMHMSKAGIYDQLISEYGENFSAEAAQYAIDNMAVDWNSNALQKAKEYSDVMHLSKAGIYNQLISDYGEKFTQEEAQYAVDNLITDYNLNALQKAKEYQSSMNLSLSEIHDQLTSEYGELFTQEEADYAIANLD